MSNAPADITMLLRASASGQRADVDALMAAIYQDMRRLAVSHMGGERRDHTLQPTALVHEAYLKLIDQRNTGWKDRLHFFAVASRIVRRILVDHARAHQADKRGGGRTRVSLDQEVGEASGPRVSQNEVHDVAARDVVGRAMPGSTRDIDLMALDDALKELGEIAPRQAQIVELRYFGGCTIDEIATLLDIGTRSVDREWQAAKAWLLVRLSDDDGEPGGPAATEDAGRDARGTIGRDADATGRSSERGR